MADAQTGATAQPETQVLTTDEFSQLLQKEFRPQSDRAKEADRKSVV